MVICMERGADLHTAQLMLLPLTVSCFSKIQIGFTFQVQVVPDRGPLNVSVFACLPGGVGLTAAASSVRSDDVR